MPFQPELNNLNPNIIAGGCSSGQVIMWDITSAIEDLKKKGNSQSNEKDETNRNSAQTPYVKHTFLSTIDKSHKKPVTDLVWLPGSMEINKKKEYVESANGNSNQFVTVSGDGGKSTQYNHESFNVCI